MEPGCKCVEESRNSEERRKREVIIQRNTKCCFKDYGEEQKKAYSRTLEALEENEYVDKAKGYADHFEDFSRDGIGLLLTGGVGTGKSTIAAGIANTLLQNGYTARFTFQSTHPTRGCDAVCSCVCDTTTISIHAPHEGVRPQYVVA